MPANGRIQFPGEAREIRFRGGGFWQFWWHPRFRECQRVAVNQNQVTQVIRTDERDCNQGGGRN